MFTEVQILLTRLRAEWERLRRDESGYSTEAVLVTALLVAIAIAVIGIIAVKVTQKADSINL
jgi:hypothetical protein